LQVKRRRKRKQHIRKRGYNMYIPGEKSIYRGFLIVEYPEGTFNAYRSVGHLKAGVASYSAGHGSSAESIRVFIDVVDDSGYFTPEQLDDAMVSSPG
jgi:hypothetical protein